MADGSGGTGGARRLNLFVLAVGKAGQSPEAELCGRYMERAERIGRSLGLSAVTVREFAEATGPTKAALEGDKLLQAKKPGPLVVLDENGAPWSSAEFAARLQSWLDAGHPNVCFAIGGADGHGEAIKAAAGHTMSLSAMTLPHLLARAILLEQLYRAVTIRLGHPYHRA